MIEDVQQGYGLERPLHAKRKRSLPPTSVFNINSSLLELSHQHPHSVEVNDAGPSSPHIQGSDTVRATSTAPSPAPFEMVSPAPSLVVSVVEPSTPATSEYLEVPSPAIEEEESDGEDGQEEGSPIMLIPKSLRMFLEDNEEVGNASAELNFAWPPSASTSGSAAPIPLRPPHVKQSTGSTPAPIIITPLVEQADQQAQHRPV
ncbi:unnamed protein product [Parnassius apollo]|uniref:(apollo) hypothetical protein n=1 Tax=Parnassius apollo TaxID=110799 RepID=A0A8S3WT31_PARAO|nr:unnamed protein product [Parnassius apollo]